MKVQILTFTPNLEEIIATGAKTCYSKLSLTELADKTLDSDNEAFIQRIMSSGHNSVLEHGVITFSIEGVSRVLLAQLTRHRHASFSVASQRYIPLKDAFSYTTPESIQNHSQALNLYNIAIKEAFHSYNSIVDMLINQYLDEDDDFMTAEKKAIEDARYVLPNATNTQLVMTMNVRELLHFFNLRDCRRSQAEIQELAGEMMKLCKEIAPTIFKTAGAPCIRGKCPEGKMTCGNPKGVKNE